METIKEEEEKVNVVEVVNNLFNKPKKVKKKRKPKKVSKPKSRTPSPPPKLPPILSDDLEKRVKYVNKRLYFCKNEADKKRYSDYLVKLGKREVIQV